MAEADDLHRSLERLVALGQSPGINIRPVLLRVLVDLFVRKSHHAPADLAQFEEITRCLLDEADDETRLIVAEKLARHPAVPAALVRRFLDEEGPAASLMLEHAPVEPETLAATAAWATPDLACAVARRPDLDPDIARSLAERPEREIALALLRNNAAPLDRATFQFLTRRIRGDADMTRAALARPGAHPADLAPLFLTAPSEQRAEILLAFRRDDLGPDSLRPRLTAEQHSALLRIERTLMTPDTDSFDAALAAALGLSLDDTWRILDDPRGEPLAVALAAAGATPELAARVFILSGSAIGHSVMAVRSLTALVGDLGMRTGARLLAAMTGTAGKVTRRSTGETAPGSRRSGDVRAATEAGQAAKPAPAGEARPSRRAL